MTVTGKTAKQQATLQCSKVKYYYTGFHLSRRGGEQLGEAFPPEGSTSSPCKLLKSHPPLNGQFLSPKLYTVIPAMHILHIIHIHKKCCMPPHTHTHTPHSTSPPPSQANVLTGYKKRLKLLAVCIQHEWLQQCHL